MNRREFIIVAGSLPVAVASGFGLCRLLGHDARIGAQTPSPQEVLTQYAAELHDMSEMGKRYLAVEPSTQDELVARLLAALPNIAGLSSVTDAELSNSISQRIRQDFAEEKICAIEGWYLSLTECRLAALSSVLNRQVGGTTTTEPVGFSGAPEGAIVDVTKWGPQKTAYAVPFNVQSDGHSGMWFVADNPPRSLVVYIDGKPFRTTISERVFTVSIANEERDLLVRTAGQHAVFVYDKVRNIKQRIGDFIVKENPE